MDTINSIIVLVMTDFFCLFVCLFVKNWGTTDTASRDVSFILWKPLGEQHVQTIYFQESGADNNKSHSKRQT